MRKDEEEETIERKKGKLGSGKPRIRRILEIELVEDREAAYSRLKAWSNSSRVTKCNFD